MVVMKCICGHFHQSHYGSGRGNCKWCDCKKFREKYKEVIEDGQKEQDQAA